MAIPFLKGIDVAGTVDLSNLTIDSAQGTDGQVLTSTGAGIAWEDATGASLSGGAANKLAIWSAADTLTNDTNLHWDTANNRLGIGDSTPSYTLDVNGTIYGSGVRSGRYYGTSGTSSYLDLDSGAPYSLIASSEINVTNTITCNDLTATEPDGIAASNGPVYGLRFYGYGNTTYYVDPNDSTTSAILNGNVGIGTTSPQRALQVSTTGSTDYQFRLGTDAYYYDIGRNTSNGFLYFYGNQSNASGFVFETTNGERMRINSSGNVGIGIGIPTQKLHVNGNVTANRYYGTGSTIYYVDPNDTGTAIYTAGDIRTASTKGFTSDGLGKLYAWRAVDNTVGNSTNYVKIARVTGTISGDDWYSDRCIIELAGRSTSYSNNALPAMGYIVAQLQSDANWDVVYYNHHNGSDEVVDEVGVVQINNTQADIYVRVGAYAEVTASGHISDGHIAVDNTRSGSAPSGYSAANAEYKVWNSGNDGSGSGLDADLLDGNHASAFLTSESDTLATVTGRGASTTTSCTFNTVTMNTPVVGTSNKIKFGNNDFIRYDDSNGAGRFHFDCDGSTNNASLQAATFVGALSGNASTATKIKAGGNGPSTEDLNTVANSVSVGQLEYRGYNSSSTNKPPASDNANGVITVGQHSGNYNAQLAFSSDGNVYWRDNPGSSNGSWRKMWDEGNDGAGSGLNADLLDDFQTTSSGNRWGVVPTVGDTGVTEVGKYIDFHESDTTTSDYNYRITSTSGRLYLSGDLEVDGGDIYINDTNTRLTEGSGNSVRVQTDSGYIDVGAQNSGLAHFFTDRNAFYFNKEIQVDTGSIRSHNEDLNLNRAGSSTARLRITSGVTYSDQYLQASGSLRAPIFYDSNDTNYKLDPNGTSNLNHLNVAGTFRFQRSSYAQTAQDDNVTVTVGDSDITFTHNNDSDGDAARYNFKYTSGGSAVDILNFDSSLANFTTPYVRCTNNSTDYAQLESNGSGGILKAVSNGVTNVMLRSYGDSYTLNDFGIGTSTPGYELDVTGEIRATLKLLLGTYGAYLSSYYSYVTTNSEFRVGYAGGSYARCRASAFTVTSDYRLKENIEPLKNPIDRLKQLKVYRFNWKDKLDEDKVDGFIAHEVSDVIPEAVAGEKDEINQDGEPEHQGLDQAKIVPLLTSALQEAILKIEQLETRIQILENQ